MLTIYVLMQNMEVDRINVYVENKVSSIAYRTFNENSTAFKDTSNHDMPIWTELDYIRPRGKQR